MLIPLNYYSALTLNMLNYEECKSTKQCLLHCHTVNRLAVLTLTATSRNKMIIPADSITWTPFVERIPRTAWNFIHINKFQLCLTNTYPFPHHLLTSATQVPIGLFDKLPMTAGRQHLLLMTAGKVKPVLNSQVKRRCANKDFQGQVCLRCWSCELL